MNHTHATAIITALLIAACGSNAPDPTPSNAEQGIVCGTTDLYVKEHRSCAPMQAEAIPDENGSCRCVLGYAWNGSACIVLSDCSCQGTDCDKLTETEEACEALHSACGSTSVQGVECGSPKLHQLTHESCASMDARAVPDENGSACYCFLGYAWDGSSCVGLANCRCEGSDCDKLTMTEEQCEQAHETCTAPPPPPYLCGSAALFQSRHDSCDAMDAIATPDDSGASCYCFLGFAWDGADCVGLADCQCKGADCDKLTQDRETCLAQHSTCSAGGIACGSPDLFARNHEVCPPMDARGDGACNCYIGSAWDGSGCQDLFGCACIGADCDKLTQDRETCLALHSTCSVGGISCGSPELFAHNHNVCEPMSAVAAPDDSGASCYCFLGFAWNGTDCVGLADCQCIGADCDKLTQDRETCLALHSTCSTGGIGCGSPELFAHNHNVCEPMDAVAAPDDSGASCYCFLGFAWNGTDCVGLTDCQCKGADCDKLSESREQCVQQHAACS